MTVWKKYGAGLGALAVATTLSLPRPAAAQIFGTDPEGLKRTDNLIKKAEDLVKSAGSAREQIGKTLDTYNAIFASDVKDVRKAYKGVEGEMAKSEKDREQVRMKLEEMKTEAEAYFSGWNASLAQIENVDLRKRSETRMTETRTRFDGVLDSVREARESYEPFMKSLNDQWTYLGHDLNANGIASLKPDAGKLNEQGKELFQKIDSGMTKGNDYIESLRASRPPS
jgi:chromosome segregation ATPase